MIFDLIKDFADVLNAMPKEYPRHRILKLLDEAIRRDVHFIDRHPTTFFQCMWNTCWWYDCSEAAKHYKEPEGGWKDPPPWESEEVKLHELLEEWESENKQSRHWLRASHPPTLRLDSDQRVVLSGHTSGVFSVAFSPDGRRILSGSHDNTIRIWDAQSGKQIMQLDGHTR